jgi:N-acetylmuramoyl-L-alanine amidase
MKIMIDAGHGPNTPGKRSPDGMREFEFNSAVANAMKAELEQYEGVSVVFAHEPGRDVPLAERTNKANKQCVKLYVSLHADALAGVMGGHGGITTFVYKTNPAEACKLAEVMQRNLVAATGLRNRTVKTADFHVLRETNMTSVLIEHGFMDSMTDLPKLKTAEYRVLCGQTNARSIAEVYGLKPKVAPQPKVSSVIRYIETGGYAGPALLEVHDYLFKTGHSFDAKRGADGSIVFLVGQFDTSMPNFNDCKGFLDKHGHGYRLLEPAQAAEWRAK